MTAPPAPRPEDVFNAAPIAGFRSAGYRHDEVLYVLQHSGAKVAVVAGGVPRL